MNLARAAGRFLLPAFACLGAAVAAPPEAMPAGQVRFYAVHTPEWDRYDGNPAHRQFMLERYLRMQVYHEYWKQHAAWYPKGWVYRNSYALKPAWPVTQQHPDWILRDSRGRRLFIPWGCDGATCPQYAGDFGNPRFRDWWLSELREWLATPYAGVWVDDVNLAWRVGNGKGEFVRPLDPRTGRLMELADWRRYMAEFMEQVRAALPAHEIAHNVIWYAGPTDDPYIRRQIDAADYINLERGASDAGLHGGSGIYGFESWLGFIDFLHSRGKGVVSMDYGSTPAQREYGLAAWLLFNNGHDLISSNRPAWAAPESWWPGYSLNLGAALGPRYARDGVLRRDFACGTVLLNQPDRSPRTVGVDRSMTLRGQATTSVSLNSPGAAILTKDCPGAR